MNYMLWNSQWQSTQRRVLYTYKSNFWFGWATWVIWAAVAQCVARRGPICSNAYGGWLAPCTRHRVRMTYRFSASLWLLESLRISHNKFLQANKGILIHNKEMNPKSSLGNFIMRHNPGSMTLIHIDSAYIITAPRGSMSLLLCTEEAIMLQWTVL